MRACLLLIAIVHLALPLGASPYGEDLGKVYKGKLDYEENALGRSWTADTTDVWELSNFSYTLDGKLEIDLGPSTVVFGKHATKKLGKNVVWAAVFPMDADSVTKIVAAQPGHGDTVTSAFLRFHPSMVRRLFPAKTVVGQGDPKWLLWGKRLYAHKINATWQAENMPVVPWKKALTFDLETQEGKRRFYSVDLEKNKVRYEQAFAGRVVPKPPADTVNEEEALAAFDKTWEAFDKEYPMFGLRPEVDWNALREQYRPLAAQAQTAYEVAGSIGLMLHHLEDLHIHVRQGGAWVPGFNRMRMLNANYRTLKSQLKELRENSRGITWGEAPGDVGYMAIWNLTNSDMIAEFDEGLEALGHTRALILDLRFNGGGDEELAQLMAGRFLEKEQTYSKNQYRSGASHDEFGPLLERKVEPRGPWRYSAPLVVLVGQKTMSSAESFALMLAQVPGAVTMGDRTAGSSANPRSLDAGLGISVNLPRWIDMDPRGKPIDKVGVQPAHVIEAASYADFRERDPVFDAALKYLKKKKGRKPGKQ